MSARPGWLPVAVVAKTFVSARPDAEIAIRIGAEVPVGASCVTIMRTGVRLAIPLPSVTGILHRSEFVEVKASRGADLLRPCGRREDR